MDDVMVRMDLQLYRIDDQNYLVDFRNLGYRPIKKDSPVMGQSEFGMPNTANELWARKPGEMRRATEAVRGKEVSSPYLFLECAVRLIVELAR